MLVFVIRISNNDDGLLVHAQHPIESLQRNAIQPRQHVFARPHALLSPIHFSARLLARPISDVRVRVNTMFICKIPLASALVCSGLLKSAGLTPSLAVSSEAVFPYQGATYTYMSTCQ